jgi:hypothetical protein
MASRAAFKAALATPRWWYFLVGPHRAFDPGEQLLALEQSARPMKMHAPAVMPFSDFLEEPLKIRPSLL